MEFAPYSIVRIHKEKPIGAPFERCAGSWWKRESKQGAKTDDL
jgi:hypothetical protein